MSRGFVLTVDSFIGLTMLLFLVLVSLYYVSQLNLASWNSIDLKNAVFDELSVLEKDSVLKGAVLESSSEGMLSALNLSPPTYCFEVVIFDKNVSSPLVHAVKTGCTKTGAQSSSAERSFVVDGNNSATIYVARATGWIG